MRRLLKAASIFGLYMLLSCPMYANETAEDNIFPSYTGFTAQVIGEAINVRSYPDIYSEVIASVDKQDVHILGQNDKWYRVSINDQEGWIAREFIKVEDESSIPYSKVLGEEIVDYGKHFIGTPYVWGGNDLKLGVDCSGLTQKIFKTFDIDISRVSYMQATDGTRVDKSELKPGDLIFFDTTGANNGRISHVGIYAGDDQFLHADSTKGVTLSSLSNTYYTRNYVMSNRILSYF